MISRKLQHRFITLLLLDDGWMVKFKMSSNYQFLPPPFTDYPNSNLQTVKFIYLFGVLRHFQHCTGHTTTGSWAEETSIYSLSGFCTVNCQPT